MNELNLPTRLVRIFTLRCEGASELLSQEQDELLALPERLAVWGHTLGCAACRRFRRQLRTIRNAARARSEGDDGALSPEARARIARAIRSDLAENDADERPS